MRVLIFLLGGLLLTALGRTQTPGPGFTVAGQTGTGRSPITFDSNAPVEPQVAHFYTAWKAEKDASRRKQFADELIRAIQYEQNPRNDLADEVTRDGLPQRLLTPPAAGKVALTPLTTLAAVDSGDDAYPPSPVFRRIADNRFEAWTSGEGWLFNARGRLVTHVIVPRRDGTGREWFGAFLPDGQWITTDLWEQDEQINAFDAKGKWLWEFKGADILAQIPREKDSNEDDADEPAKKIICWARADRIGHGWVVCIGEDWNTDRVLVSEDKHVEAVPAGETEWNLIYPRAMGVRGFYTGMGIVSDDGKLHLSREEPMHGMGVGWPVYTLSATNWSNVVREGDWNFGFWPKSHALFIEAEGDTYEAAHRVWFFDDSGKYAGEIAGVRLGDAADGRSLLVMTPDHGVATVSPSAQGPSAAQTRDFTWSDGTRAIPLALFDDLRLGFFLRGPVMEGQSDDARRARAAADIVLARW